MKDKELYNIIDKKLTEKDCYYIPYKTKELKITDEKNRTLNITAWKNQKGFIHFQTADEQYRFTGKKELVFEGLI